MNPRRRPLTEAEAAKQLGISHAALTKMRVQGRAPPHILIDRQVHYAFMEIVGAERPPTGIDRAMTRLRRLRSSAIVLCRWLRAGR